MNKNFLNDRFFLLRHNLRMVGVYLVLCASLLLFQNAEISGPSAWLIFPMLLLALPHFGLNLLGGVAYMGVLAHSGSLSLGAADGWILLMGMVFGVLSGSLMHNAAHLNFGSRKLSNFVGELCGLQQIVGYKEWQIAHIFYHHRYPDHPEKDPHAPLGMSFFKYSMMMKFNIARSFEKNYLSIWGQGSENKRNWGLTGLSILATMLLRVSFWYLLLGPKYFLVFFVVSNLSVHALYNHFNYFTHRPNEEGNFEILDLNDGLFKFVNFATFGAYIHKRHHENARLFNPSKGFRVSATDRAWISEAGGSEKLQPERPAVPPVF